MKSNIFRLVIIYMIIPFLYSCKDQYPDSIILEGSGSLNVQILNSGVPVPDVKVGLYGINYGWQYSSTTYYDKLITDKNGFVEFGKYNAGDYRLDIEATAETGFFEFNESIQALSGENGSKTIDLSDYLTDLTVKFYDESAGDVMKDLSGYTVKLLPYSFLEDLDNGEQEELMEAMDAFDLTAPVENGEAVFANIPVGFYTGVLVSADQVLIRQLGSGISLSKNEPETHKVDINGLQLALTGRSFAISSVTNTTGGSLDHNYSTLSFSADGFFVLIMKDYNTPLKLDH